MLQYSHPSAPEGVTTVAELKTEVAEELQTSSPQGHSAFVQGHQTCQLTVSDHPHSMEQEQEREQSTLISVTWYQSRRYNSST